LVVEQTSKGMQLPAPRSEGPGKSVDIKQKKSSKDRGGLKRSWEGTVVGSPPEVMYLSWGLTGEVLKGTSAKKSAVRGGLVGRGGGLRRGPRKKGHLLTKGGKSWEWDEKAPRKVRWVRRGWSTDILRKNT